MKKDLSNLTHEELIYSEDLSPEEKLSELNRRYDLLDERKMEIIEGIDPFHPEEEAQLELNQINWEKNQIGSEIDRLEMKALQPESTEDISSPALTIDNIIDSPAWDRGEKSLELAERYNWMIAELRILDDNKSKDTEQVIKVKETKDQYLADLSKIDQWFISEGMAGNSFGLLPVTDQCKSVSVHTGNGYRKVVRNEKNADQKEMLRALARQEKAKNPRINQTAFCKMPEALKIAKTYAKGGPARAIKRAVEEILPRGKRGHQE